jgi:SAM-dependent methyltransferase
LDAVITKFSLHHLPDHWKFVAVKRIFDMLKPGGKFFLKDAMISADINDFFDSADYWVSATREMSGDKPAEATVLFIKDEYPTYSWIMEEMLKRVGFSIDNVNILNSLHTIFVCSKP